MATNKEKSVKCSFCGKSQDGVDRIIAGPGVYICNECVKVCSNIIEDDLYEDTELTYTLNEDAVLPSPAEIKAVLDTYVIGQEEAKKTLSVAVYNHYKRISNEKEQSDDDVEIQKSNVLLLGPTGCGKTLLAQTLAKILEVPFAIADATTLTEAGYVGEDVENILFICGGAFEGLEKIVKDRIGKKSIGFGATIESNKEIDKYKVFEQLLPQDLLKFGLIPEFVGRLPIIATLEELDKQALIDIVTKPKNALVKQYKKLFAMDNVELEFEDEALGLIVDKAIERKTGARGLRSIIEEIMRDIMFEIPSNPKIEKCIITKDTIKKGGKPELIINENRNLEDIERPKRKSTNKKVETA